MKTIEQAVREYKNRYPKATAVEINAFIYGWTAHEVSVEVARLLILKSN